MKVGPERLGGDMELLLNHFCSRWWLQSDSRISHVGSHLTTVALNMDKKILPGSKRVHTIPTLGQSIDHHVQG